MIIVVAIYNYCDIYWLELNLILEMVIPLTLVPSYLCVTDWPLKIALNNGGNGVQIDGLSTPERYSLHHEIF